MFLPQEVLSEAFSSISRQQLADLQLVSRQFDSIIAAKVYPLHEGKCEISLKSKNNEYHTIYLDTYISSAPIPSYLRFIIIDLWAASCFTTRYIDLLTRLENAFAGGEMTFNLPCGPCETEHDLRLRTFNLIKKWTPVFHKVKDILLFVFLDEDEGKTLPTGPEDDINILSTPLLLNCRRLHLFLKRERTDRLGLVSPDQVVDWLFPGEERDGEGHYLAFSVNRGTEAILTDLISKRAKSMTERHSDVVVEFLNGDPGRICKYPRKIADN